MQDKQQLFIPSYHIEGFSLSDAITHVHTQLCPSMSSNQKNTKCGGLDDIFNRLREFLNTTHDLQTLKNDNRQFAPYMEKVKPERMVLNSMPDPDSDVYYNYVIGYYADAKLYQYEGMVLRVSRYTNDEMDAYKSFIRDNPKSKMTYETFIGSKHRQIAGADLVLVFSGVLIVKNGKVVVSPMSGSWKSLIEPMSKDKDPKILNVLNVLNIIATQYAFSKVIRGDVVPASTSFGPSTPFLSIGKMQFRSYPRSILQTSIIRKWKIDYPNCLLHYAGLCKTENCDKDIPQLLDNNTIQPIKKKSKRS